MKIEKALELEEGTLVILQSWFDIHTEKEKQKNTGPDLSILRKALFWDTDINQIDWDKKYKAVIQRVFEKGNEEEKKEIIRFYGGDKVQMVLGMEATKPRRSKPKAS